MPVTGACLGDLFQPVAPGSLCESLVNFLPLCAWKPDGCVRADLIPTSHRLCVVHRVYHPLKQLVSVGGGWTGAGEFDSDAA